MAEMTTLMAAIYRKYRTEVQTRQAGVSPGITSRFEIFRDETFDAMKVCIRAHEMNSEDVANNVVRNTRAGLNLSADGETATIC